MPPNDASSTGIVSSMRGDSTAGPGTACRDPTTAVSAPASRLPRLPTQPDSLTGVPTPRQRSSPFGGWRRWAARRNFPFLVGVAAIGTWLTGITRTEPFGVRFEHSYREEGGLFYECRDCCSRGGSRARRADV